MWVRLSNWVGAAVLGLAIGCQPPPREKPVAPNMDALLTAYAAPSAALDAQSILEVLGRYDEEAAVISALCGLADLNTDCAAAGTCGQCAGISTLLASFGTLVDDGGTEGAARERIEALVDGQGYARLHRICDGLGPVPVAEAEQSGSLSLNLGFTEEGFDPVVWGEVRRCATRRAGFALTIDGDVQISMGQSWLLAELKERPALIALRGELTVQGAAPIALDVDLEAPLVFAAEHLTRRELRLRLQLQRGEVIFFVGENGRGFDASNGRFTCDLEQRRCQNDRGQALLTW